MTYSKLPIIALTAAFMTAPTIVVADDHDNSFAEGRLFFELNDTDGDLGIHGKIDGDAWKVMEIEDPNERRMLKVRASGRLKRQGMTELFFESAEPTFDELDPLDFFDRFPEGIYEIEGKTLEGDELENEVYLSHVIPAAPAGVTITGVDEMTSKDAAASCDADILPKVDPSGGVTIGWDAVDTSHGVLGRDFATPLDMLSHTPDGEEVPIVVLSYEVVVEVDETPYVTTAIVPGDVTEWTFSEDFFDLSDDDEYKFEILVRINNGQLDAEDKPIPGNKSAVESCFELAD